MQAKAPVPESYRDDVPAMEKAVELMDKISEYTSLVKGMSDALDKKCRDQYEKLSDEEIIELLVNRKWFNSLFNKVDGLYTALSHYLAGRIITLANRYERTLPEITQNVVSLEKQVKSHLERMGFTW